MEIPATIDEYIAQFPERLQEILRETRQIIAENAPGAMERISYRMPCFWHNGPLIYFAAMKNHLGIYPGLVERIPFPERLTGYKTSKGAIQFPYNKPIDYDLIADITRWRVSYVKENE